MLLCGFVNFDDPLHVTENPHLRGGLGEVARWAASADRSGNWFPLTWLSHALDVRLFGLAPAGHHATSLLLHALNALLVFLWLARATGDRARSALVALVFAVHPIHVESVAWVSERKGVLSMAFGLLALLAWTAYAQQGRRGAYAAALAAHAASLAAKPTFVSLPLLLLLLDLWPLRRAPGAGGGPPAGSWARLAAEKLPFVALSCISSAVTLVVQQPALASAADVGPGVRLANAALAAVTYLRQLVLPTGLSVLYPYSLAPPLGAAALAAFGLAAVTGLVLARRRSRPWLTAGWLWFAVALVPMIGLVQVGHQAHADRYAYLPFLGLYIAVAASLPDTWLRRPLRCGAAAALALLLLAGGALTWRRIGDWRDGVALFESAVRVEPGNVLALRHLGDALGRAGRLDEARARYEEALALHPRFVEARSDLALLLLRQGRDADAETELRRALALDPAFADAHASLGALLAQGGRFDEALVHLRAALEAQPRRPDVQRNLGLVLARLGRAEEAEAALRRAAALEPGSADAHALLGYALAARGARAEAAAALETALRLDPAHAEARAHLARLRAGGSGDGDARRSDPGSPDRSAGRAR